MDIKPGGNSSGYGATAAVSSNYNPVPAGSPAKSPTQLYSEANVKRDYIPKGTHGRKVKRTLRPRYITIHSTQNYSSQADAWQHSKALKNGALSCRKVKGGNRIGYLTWHYTVDQSVAVQHLPTNEQGEHADYDGPGNNYSIGIEMCENRGNDRARTLDRTAKLTAYLMHQYKIPINRVVPHYHWPRFGHDPMHKNCPHFLLDNGRPGKKWRQYQAQIKKHYDSITKPAGGMF
ncbi:peptidoglycan recognition protein family protein [Persicirhabdus sediminis]|uniref:peptidoglycan recognition protein family protein n=1 Tax=Persicirhabdus sediminis TaxID=454144 RepID=UPI002D7F3EFF|nr:N-acetylmuramoyl-L-alanine amidase [Persicirhabdus sediminis]